MTDEIIHDYPYAFGYLKSSMRMLADNIYMQGLISKENVKAVKQYIDSQIKNMLEDERAYSAAKTPQYIGLIFLK
jgi:translation initiation factor RLI1